MINKGMSYYRSVMYSILHLFHARPEVFGCKDVVPYHIPQPNMSYDPEDNTQFKFLTSRHSQQKFPSQTNLEKN